MRVSGSVLEAECRAFTQYLLGCEPQAYAVEKYVEAHEVSPVFSTATRFDHILVQAAGKSRAFTKIADSYARLFAPNTLLRKKPVLLLAILETSGPSFRLIDEVNGGGLLILSARVATRGAIFGLSVLAGAVLFLPAQLIFRTSGRT